jgi:uncharacterized protein YfdQ (DUF2303 family)
MFDESAIKQLSKSEAITAASQAITGQAPSGAILALPNDFSLHSLEQYQKNRRRARGSMETPLVADFAKYIEANKEDGATVFVQQTAMTAVAVLNLGSPSTPGHTDNTAKLAPKKTAAFHALKFATNGTPKKQQDVAEFFEDWPEHLKFFNDKGTISPPQAIAAIRKITIENIKKLDNHEGNLSAQKSTFESISATSVDPIPTTIYFTTVPLHGLKAREFVLRLNILSGSDKPMISLRIVNQELHDEEMATELVELVTSAVNDVPVLIGEYQSRS